MPGPSNNAELQLAIASLGDWLPDAGGRLNGNFSIRGKASALSVNGTLNGRRCPTSSRRSISWT